MKQKETENITSIEDVLFEAKKAAFKKVYIPEHLSDQYEFIINETTKKCTIKRKKK